MGNFGGQKAVGWYIQCAKRKTLSTKNPTSTKMSFKSEGEIKTFPDKQKLKGFMITKPDLQEMLKRVLQGKMKGHQTVT